MQCQNMIRLVSFYSDFFSVPLAMKHPESLKQVFMQHEHLFE
jgi:hypothetical protein